MATIYLHIGLHKTGSTALQYFFAMNSAAMAREGYYYPSVGRPDQEKISYGHHLLAWSLFRDRKLLTVWPKLIREFQEQEPDNIVVSSEEFDVLASDQIALIREYLADYEVRLVVYLRKQDEFAQAYYTTDVVFNREVRDFDHYVASIRTKLDYNALLADWVAHFGRENMIVRVYEKHSLVAGDIIRDFCRQIGLELQEQYRMPPRDINKGYPRNVVDMVRNMKKIQVPAEFIFDFIAIAERIYDRQKGYDILAPSKAKELMELFADSNSRVAREYFGQATLFRDDGLPFATEEEWRKTYMQKFGSLGKTIKDIKAFIAGHSSE